MKQGRNERMCMWKDMNRCNINVQYKTVNTGCWLVGWGGGGGLMSRAVIWLLVSSYELEASTRII